MELRTKIEITPLKLKIDHAKRGLMLGSCFAESIADAQIAAKFDLVKNPFGVLYNPLSIAEAIARLDSGREFTKNELHSKDDMWFSFSHHGSFSSTNPDTAIENINRSFNIGVAALAESDYVVITLGTAWVYRRTADGSVAANCHKLPGAEFIRSRLSADQIVELYEPLLKGVLRSKNVLFTVSPIRHVKDGLAENSLSKATLLVAVNQMCSRFENVEYFPSYEIMIDDLRDYRFYKEDMLHPTAQAIDYIWTLFQQAVMTPQTKELVEQITRISRAVNHRPLNPNSTSHTKFRNQMLLSVQQLQVRNRTIDFTDELNFFSDK